jgi:DprA winged helix domain
MQPETGHANLLIAASLTPSEKKLYDLLTSDEPQPFDDIVERSGLNSSEVLATLFDLEKKGIIRQLPGKIIQQGSSVAGKLQGVVAGKGLTTLVYKVARRTQPKPAALPSEDSGVKLHHGSFFSNSGVACEGEDHQ